MNIDKLEDLVRKLEEKVRYLEDLIYELNRTSLASKNYSEYYNSSYNDYNKPPKPT